MDWFPVLLVGFMLLMAALIGYLPMWLFIRHMNKPVRYEHWTDAEEAGMFNEKSTSNSKAPSHRISQS